MTALPARAFHLNLALNASFQPAFRRFSGWECLPAGWGAPRPPRPPRSPAPRPPPRPVFTSFVIARATRCAASDRSLGSGCPTCALGKSETSRAGGGGGSPDGTTSRRGVFSTSLALRAALDRRGRKRCTVWRAQRFVVRVQAHRRGEPRRRLQRARRAAAPRPCARCCCRAAPCGHHASDAPLDRARAWLSWSSRTRRDVHSAVVARAVPLPTAAGAAGAGAGASSRTPRARSPPTPKRVGPRQTKKRFTGEDALTPKSARLRTPRAFASPKRSRRLGVASRRASEALVFAGRVTVNGAVVTRAATLRLSAERRRRRRRQGCRRRPRAGRRALLLPPQ